MCAGTMGNMTPTKKPDAEKRNAEREAALTFVRMAKEKGLDLTGPDGLLKQFTKSVLETALDEEMTEHLGRAKHKKSKDGRAANTRNGTTAKTVVTDSVGPVGIEVPRDRDGSFEPVVVRKRQRRLPGVGEVVLSLYARGLTTGEISAHFQEIYGADVSRETVSRITERVVAEKDEWCSRPLDRVYAAVFIDATVVKVARRAGRQPRVLRGRWRGSGGRPRRAGHLDVARRRGGGPRRDAGQVGGEISRDPQAVDGRVGTVHTVPGL